MLWADQQVSSWRFRQQPLERIPAIGPAEGLPASGPAARPKRRFSFFYRGAHSFLDGCTLPGLHSQPLMPAVVGTPSAFLNGNGRYPHGVTWSLFLFPVLSRSSDRSKTL